MPGGSFQWLSAALVDLANLESFDGLAATNNTIGLPVAETVQHFSSNREPVHYSQSLSAAFVVPAGSAAWLSLAATHSTIGHHDASALKHTDCKYLSLSFWPSFALESGEPINLW